MHATLSQSIIFRQPTILNMSKRLAWRWVEEPMDNEPTKQIFLEQRQRQEKEFKFSTATKEALQGGGLRAEIGAVKAENKRLLAKVDLLRNDGLQTRLETVELKLKVAKLETKLAEKDMQDLLTEKLTEESTGQLGVELCNEIPSKSVWSTNQQWHITGTEVQMSADGLVVTANPSDVNVRAQQPISLSILASAKKPVAGSHHFVYYEVLIVKKLGNFMMGWVGADFPLKHSDFWIGKHLGSYGIVSNGNYWNSGHKFPGYVDGFAEKDVVGTGLSVTRYESCIKMFFTKNGQLNGKPIILTNLDQLYPAISFDAKHDSVEANFGADPAGKPFKFDINAHEAQLFNH